MPDVLFVCTGNQCRSPLADASAWRSLRRRDIEAEVASAGVLRGGAPLAPETLRVLAQRGIDGGDRRSQQISRELVSRSALILGMDRGHVREVAVLDGDAWRRTFTLKEAVRRAHDIGPRRFAEPLATWAERLGAGRSPNDMLGQSSDDDIADPMGAPYSVHEQTALVIDELVEELVDLAWPDGPR
jgi:protein-tyrosine phosphatase